MSTVVFAALAASLALTIAIESGFSVLIGIRNKKDLLLVIMVNVLTNPIVVLLYWIAVYYTNWNTVLVIIPLELFAVLTEGFYYKKYAQKIKRPFIFSIAANAVSYSIGFIIQQFI